MSDPHIPGISAILNTELGLELSPTLSEEELMQLLADRIGQVILQGPTVFFMLMYRLDVAERKLRNVMHERDAPARIARLVYDRQLAKIKSRADSPRQKDDTDPDLDW